MVKINEKYCVKAEKENDNFKYDIVIFNKAGNVLINKQVISKEAPEFDYIRCGFTGEIYLNKRFYEVVIAGDEFIDVVCPNTETYYEYTAYNDKVVNETNKVDNKKPGKKKSSNKK